MNKNKTYFFIIALVGFTIYFNSLFNGFTADDSFYVQNNPRVIAPEHIFTFFVGSNVGEIQENPLQVYYYYFKPLSLLSFATINSIFGMTPFYFHILQVLLHILNAFLIFLLFSRFFSNKLALLLGLVFLTHPINVESVAYISALQEPLFLFFGLLCLYFVNKFSLDNKFTKKRMALVCLLLLFSVLSKESGVLFFAIILIRTLIFQKNKLTTYLSISFFASIFYLYLRLVVGNTYFRQLSFIPIGQEDLLTRIINIPKIVWSYLSTFLYPLDISFMRLWVIKTPTLQDFYIPLFLVSIFMLCIFALGIFTWKHNKTLFKPYLFFLAWFLIGLGLHLHILRFLDATATDRWFYFPIIGLLGLIGVAFSFIRIQNRRAKQIVVFFAIIILILLSLRTIVRNFNWHDSYTLMSHDVKVDTENFYLENALGKELHYKKRYQEAKEAFLKSSSIFPQSTALANLATMYQDEGNLEKAEEYWYRSSTEFPYEIASTYENLSETLLKNHKPKEAKAVIEKALKKFPNNDRFWTILMFAEFNIGDKQKATEAAYKAYSLYGNPTYKKNYEILINNLPINNIFQ